MITILPYNPTWPAQFEAIAADLRRALGSLALRIDHIGSTSVPGLPAKDIIDIQVTVRGFDDALVDAFIRAGYAYREGNTQDHLPPGFDGPESEWEKRYFREPPGGRVMHIHVRAAGRANQRYPLLFRDYLRAHPAAAEAYAALKRVLAEYHGSDHLAYTTIKDPACDLIIAAAEDWAQRTGWTV